MKTRRAAATIAATLSLLLLAIVPTPSGAQDQDGPDLGNPVVGVSAIVTGPGDPTYEPAVTYLQAEFPGTAPAGCTGTLVAPQWVLTAAHCVMLDNGAHATEIVLLVGSVDAASDFFSPAPGVEVFEADGWVIHGDASIGPNWWNDVAMVHLPSPASITPMALATDTSLTEPASNNASDRLDARFYGFGVHEFDLTQDFRLRRGESTIFTKDFVRDVFNPPLSNFLSTKEINRNTFMFPDLDTQGGGCFGDSGGPMVVLQDGDYRVAGVNSFISSPVTGRCDPFVGFPGVSEDFLLHAVADLVGTNLGDWVTSIRDGSGTCAGQPVAIIGSGQDDILVGTADANVMSGRGGNDVLLGGGGGDLLCGGSGNDDIRGGGGGDKIRGNGGNDDLRGQGGNDNIKGNGGDDDATGGSGRDTIKGGGGNDTIEGNGGADTLKGQNGDDEIRGNGKGDTIEGGKGADDLGGGKGADVIEGGRQDDVLAGNGGGDTLRGNGGADSLDGGGGNDTCSGGPGQDTEVNC